MFCLNCSADVEPKDYAVYPFCSEACELEFIATHIDEPLDEDVDENGDIVF